MRQSHRIRPSYLKLGEIKYGGFQEYAVMPLKFVCTIPDSLSFAKAATLPMAICTTSTEGYIRCLPFVTKFKPEDKMALLA
ncbi:hypothetical protein V1512DRAFT_258093 [Lipomyces arxii]|uniref:uncharacterized protein n=1 Tax=Lipomyces arxii TaxID=56418 RepID=UPI0034CECF21